MFPFGPQLKVRLSSFFVSNFIHVVGNILSLVYLVYFQFRPIKINNYFSVMYHTFDRMILCMYESGPLKRFISKSIHYLTFSINQDSSVQIIHLWSLFIKMEMGSNAIQSRPSRLKTKKDSSHFNDCNYSMVTVDGPRGFLWWLQYELSHKLPLIKHLDSVSHALNGQF